jgi:hypothetical protein
MAVSKRLRYEVLRRDNHTCRYCGAVAPQVKLTVDHVVPQALGGGDEPSNLVTACESCNNGKTSVPADAPIVADVEQDALRWAAAMDKAAEMARAKYEVRLDYRNAFREAWDEWKSGPEHAQQPIPLDLNWESSLDNFYEAGLPDWELNEAVRAAMTNSKVTPSNTFRYFAGICWTKIRKMQEQAQQIVQEGNQPSGRVVSEETVGEIIDQWFSAYRKHHAEENHDEDPKSDEWRARRLRDVIVALLEQGYSTSRVSEAAGRAGRWCTFVLTDYLGGCGDFYFDAAVAWTVSWGKVDPEHKWWRTSVPTPARWVEFKEEIQGAVSAGLPDLEILEACKLAGEQHSALLFGLPDWEGRWD